jgi:hypothetical protein
MKYQKVLLNQTSRIMSPVILKAQWQSRPHHLMMLVATSAWRVCEEVSIK